MVGRVGVLTTKAALLGGVLLLAACALVFDWEAAALPSVPQRPRPDVDPQPVSLTDDLKVYKAKRPRVATGSAAAPAPAGVVAPAALAQDTAQAAPLEVAEGASSFALPEESPQAAPPLVTAPPQDARAALSAPEAALPSGSPEIVPPQEGGDAASSAAGMVPPQAALPSGVYEPQVLAEGRECTTQAAKLGAIPSLEGCDKLAAAEPACGSALMFSQAHPDWQCRCCEEGGAEGGEQQPAWSVYAIRTPRTAKKVEQSKVDQGKGGVKGKGGHIMARGRECAKQALSLGHMKTAKECDRIAANTEECGSTFMFSAKHPDWQCRCCTADGADRGPEAPAWDIYTVLAPRPSVFVGVPTLAPPQQPYRGLPVFEGPRPAWLIKEDELVVDARPAGGGGILIIQAVLMDLHSTWGRQTSRPHWLRAILATNKKHAQKHGHAMILRASPSQPQLTKWQWRACGMTDVASCVKENERENFNWEKHLMIAEYLLSPEMFSHVLMLDADAALVHTQHDTLRGIAEILDTKGKSIFLTDEDWLENGAGRINGGLILVRNTKFTKDLFQDTFDAHLKGSARLQQWRIGIDDMECSSNEQICLNDLWSGKGEPIFKPQAMMASGKVYNRGAESGGVQHLGEDSVEVMHWMGGSKASAGTALCGHAFDYTGDRPRGYGCKP